MRVHDSQPNLSHARGFEIRYTGNLIPEDVNHQSQIFKFLIH